MKVFINYQIVQVCFNYIKTIIRINHLILLISLSHFQINPGREFILLCITRSKIMKIFSPRKACDITWRHNYENCLKLPPRLTTVEKIVFIKKHSCEACKHSMYWLSKNKENEQWESLLGQIQHYSKYCSLTSKHTSPLMRWEPCILINLQLQSQPSLPTSNVNTRLTPMPFLWKMWECPGSKCSLFPWG